MSEAVSKREKKRRRKSQNSTKSPGNPETASMAQSMSHTGDMIAQANMVQHGYATPQQGSPQFVCFSSTGLAPQPGQQPSHLQMPTNLTQHMETPSGWFQEIVNRLDRMESKLGTLGKIETSVTLIGKRVDDLEGKFSAVEKCITFVSGQYDEQVEAYKQLKGQVDEIAKRTGGCKVETPAIDEIRALGQSVVDIKTRSMRENLIFKGIPEAPDGVTENCERVIQNFIREEIGIHRNISFVRVHRLGKPSPKAARANVAVGGGEHGRQHEPVATEGSDTIVVNTMDEQQESRPRRPRPIVAKFERYKDRELVRIEAPTALKGKNVFVDEHFPIEVERKRRILYPIRSAAKRAGDKINLVVDKLYINGEPYTPGEPVSKTKCDILKLTHDPEHIRAMQRTNAIQRASEWNESVYGRRRRQTETNGNANPEEINRARNQTPSQADETTTRQTTVEEDIQQMESEVTGD